MYIITQYKRLAGVLLIFLIIMLQINEASALDNLKKEKKALTEFIKNEYDSWTKTYPELTALDSHKIVKISHEADIALRQNHLKSTAPTPKPASYKRNPMITPPNSFSDFQFTIVNNQAIVQFAVNDQLVSAFFEKDNGQWKLICAAHLNKPI